MANDEYQVPSSISIEQPPQTAEFTDIPETFRGSGYVVAKQKAAEIQQWRASADETLIPRRLTRRALDGIVKRVDAFLSTDLSKPLMDRLINTESRIGGSLFPPQEGVISQRFWLDMPHTADADDWFYECTDAQGSMSAHYVIRRDGSEKLSNGRPVPFVRGDGYDEEAVLLERIDEYHRAVQEFYAA